MVKKGTIWEAKTRPLNFTKCSRLKMMRCPCFPWNGRKTFELLQRALARTYLKIAVWSRLAIRAE